MCDILFELNVWIDDNFEKIAKFFRLLLCLKLDLWDWGNLF